MVLNEHPGAVLNVMKVRCVKIALHSWICIGFYFTDAKNVWTVKQFQPDDSTFLPSFLITGISGWVEKDTQAKCSRCFLFFHLCFFI